MFDESVCASVRCADRPTIDWSDSLHGTNYLDDECDLTKDLLFADGSFDSILLSGVLEHIPTPERLWREMARYSNQAAKCS